MCNPNNGKCFCTTKGIKGDRCHLWVSHFMMLACLSVLFFTHAMSEVFTVIFCTPRIQIACRLYFLVCLCAADPLCVTSRESDSTIVVPVYRKPSNSLFLTFSRIFSWRWSFVIVRACSLALWGSKLVTGQSQASRLLQSVYRENNIQWRVKMWIPFNDLVNFSKN